MISGWRQRVAAIALELSLTFVGVLAALAVDNFRESVQEHERERNYLVAFRGALQEDTTTVNLELERAFFKLNAATRLLTLIETSDSITSRELGQVVESILMLIDPAYNTAVYEDIKATGNSRIIRNIKLKNDIIAHYLYLNKLIALQQGSIQFISYNQVFVDQFQFEELQNLESLSPKNVLDRLKTDKELRKYLIRLQKAMLTYRNSLLYSALPKTLVLLDKVDGELKKNK